MKRRRCRRQTSAEAQLWPPCRVTSELRGAAAVTQRPVPGLLRLRPAMTGAPARIGYPGGNCRVRHPRHEERSMASNIALRRFKKAVRRKSQVAERLKPRNSKGRCPHRSVGPWQRRSSNASSRITFSKGGLGMLLVARGVTTHQFALASFLLNSYCLGIKDVMFRSVEAEEFALFLDTMAISSPLTPVDPAYAQSCCATWPPGRRRSGSSRTRTLRPSSTCSAT